MVTSISGLHPRGSNGTNLPRMRTIAGASWYSVIRRSTSLNKSLMPVSAMMRSVIFWRLSTRLLIERTPVAVLCSASASTPGLNFGIPSRVSRMPSASCSPSRASRLTAVVCSGWTAFWAGPRPRTRPPMRSDSKSSRLTPASRLTYVRGRFARYRLSRYCRVSAVFSSWIGRAASAYPSPITRCGIRIGLMTA